MSDRKVILPGSWFATEISHTTFLLAVATGIVLDGAKATVTSASHLLVTGDYTTFSGATGVTALNNATWGPITKTSSSIYTFPCTLTGSVTGSPVQEKLYFFAPGSWICLLGANGGIEYCPDNAWGKAFPNSTSGTDATWRDFADAGAPTVAFDTDGYAFRFRDEGTTATSYFSKVS